MSRTEPSRKAVFLDRDGVLIRDVHYLQSADQIELLPDVADALAMLADAGFARVVVSNQPVIARGMVTEEEVTFINQDLEKILVAHGAPCFDAMYFCPYHPNADLERYRKDHECRKPRPGMLFQAARELNLNLSLSYMIGDRVSDIVAGKKAGCTTVLLKTGMHGKPIIETTAIIDDSVEPDYICSNLSEAVQWIVRKT